ncbi:DUF4307 domain-containing protein [Microterricola viridarii]|uniref:DUF4307 domain-containing protein n=1 Tax=Microterricola viridarii TaxID=412690 RepID=A0A1H1XLS9_9MICO|nr:DUF4307 domain-containing protein [Microterricola viridarii]SDT10275.1 protein of unknown function [Microterricola viridarii]
MSTANAQPADLDQRYGRSPRKGRRDRLTLIISAAMFAVVLVAWVVWAGLDGSKPMVEARDVAHTVIDDQTVRVDYEVSMPIGESATCAVQALNEDFAVVGWKIVDVPASDRFTQAFSDTVRTALPANTGLIFGCWLA